MRIGICSVAALINAMSIVADVMSAPGNNSRPAPLISIPLQVRRYTSNLNLRMAKFIFSIIIAHSLLGCSSTTPQHLNLISKVLKPKNDKALIYVVRPFKFTGSALSPTFSFNGVDIGNLESSSYVYVYAYPMELLLQNTEIGVLKTNIEAGKVYFFEYRWADGYSQISQEEGRRFLMKYSLSSHFKPQIIGQAPTKNLQAEHGQKENIESYLQYDDITKIGVIKYAAKIDERHIVFNKIEDICNTKNIAIQANSMQQNLGSTYKTLDEKFSNNLYEISFQCLY